MSLTLRQRSTLQRRLQAIGKPPLPPRFDRWIRWNNRLKEFDYGMFVVMFLAGLVGFVFWSALFFLS